MHISKETKKEAVHISIGTVGCCVLMDLVFLFLGKFDITVLLGSLLGASLAVGNLFYLAFCVEKASEKGEQAKGYMQRTYILRCLATIAVVILGFVVPVFQPWSVVLPIFFPRLVIFGLQLFGFYNPKMLQDK